MSKQKFYKYKKGDYVDIWIYPLNKPRYVVSRMINGKTYVDGLAHYNIAGGTWRKEQDIIGKTTSKRKEK